MTQGHVHRDESNSGHEPLRLIQVRHYRCREADGYTFILARLAWTAPEVQKRLDAAERSYLAALEVAKAEDPRPPYPHVTPQYYEAHPEKTVGELKQAADEQRALFTAWEQGRRETRRDFTSFLLDQGFVSLFSDAAGIPDFEVDWGHRHGERIDYEDTNLDTFPPPCKVVDPDFSEYDEGDFG